MISCNVKGSLNWSVVHTKMINMVYGLRMLWLGKGRFTNIFHVASYQGNYPWRKWPGALLLTWFNFNPSMDKQLHYKVWDDTMYAFPNFNGCTVEIWEWIINFISRCIQANQKLNKYALRMYIFSYNVHWDWGVIDTYYYLNISVCFNLIFIRETTLNLTYVLCISICHRCGPHHFNVAILPIIPFKFGKHSFVYNINNKHHW